MPDTANAKLTEKFENYQLYFRTRNRESENYHELVRRIKREPNIVYPDGWFDADIDRVMRGKYCVHFGMYEIKEVDALKNPFCWNYSGRASRNAVKKMLANSHYHIEYCTTNYTIRGTKGVRLDNKWNAYPDWNYDKYLSNLRRNRLLQGLAGKGVFLFIFCSENLEYFSVINFTGSEYIFGAKDGYIRSKEFVRNDGGGNRLYAPKGKIEKYLEYAGGIIEPCFNEFLLFLVEAYVRHDFETLYYYLTSGEEEDLIRFSDSWEKDLVEYFTSRRELVAMWSAFCDAMEWILDCIHIDTILENREKYIEFAELVKKGKILGRIRKIIKNTYKRCMQTLHANLCDRVIAMLSACFR